MQLTTEKYNTAQGSRSGKPFKTTTKPSLPSLFPDLLNWTFCREEGLSEAFILDD
jgi:hypothetical protein